MSQAKPYNRNMVQTQCHEGAGSAKCEPSTEVCKSVRADSDVIRIALTIRAVDKR